MIIIYNNKGPFPVSIFKIQNFQLWPELSCCNKLCKICCINIVYSIPSSPNRTNRRYAEISELGGVAKSSVLYRIWSEHGVSWAEVHQSVFCCFPCVVEVECRRGGWSRSTVTVDRDRPGRLNISVWQGDVHDAEGWGIRYDIHLLLSCLHSWKRLLKDIILMLMYIALLLLLKQWWQKLHMNTFIAASDTKCKHDRWLVIALSLYKYIHISRLTTVIYLIFPI